MASGVLYILLFVLYMTYPLGFAPDQYNNGWGNPLYPEFDYYPTILIWTPILNK